jgi:predicted RNase H-like HicB family nuclease
MKKPTDAYHRWVAWSDADQCYLGWCPDLFFGGVHGDDPIEVARELQQAIDEWESIHLEADRELPAPKTRPMRELV